MTALIRRLPSPVTGPNAGLLTQYVEELPVAGVFRRYSAWTVKDLAGLPADTVPDLSGQAATLAAVSGATPAYVQVEGGVPHLELNNGRTTDRMIAPAQALPANSPFTLYSVCRFPVALSTVGQRWAVVAMTTGMNPSMQVYSTGRQASLYRGATLDSALVVPVGQWLIMVGVFNGASSVIRVDGNEATGTTTLDNAGVNGQFNIGQTGGTAGPPHRIDIRETGAIQGALSLSDRAALVASLRGIYSL